MTPPMRSSKFLGVVTTADAECFLEDWVNLEEHDIQRFLMHHTFFMPDEFQQWVTPHVLIRHRDTLRKAWDTQSPFLRNWCLSLVRMSISIWFNAVRSGVRNLRGVDERTMDVLQEPPEKPSPIYAALLYLEIVIADRAKHCGSADCERPYFIGEKRWQRYCSPSCARPAVLAAKRKWFEDKGQKRRARARRRKDGKQ